MTDDTEERSESPDELPASPASQYFTAPSSRRTTDLGRVPSPTFDTTQDEMALFEMFGEDYDEVVAAMTHEERVALGEKLSNRGEEELLEVAKKLRHMMKGRTSSVGSSLPPVIMEEVNQSIGSDVSPFSIASSNNMTPSPNLLPNTVELNLDVQTIEETLNNSHITSPPSKKINLLNTPTVFKSANMSRTEDLVQSPIFSYPNNLSFDEPHVMEMAEATVDNVHSDVNYENVDHTEDNVPAPSPCVTFSNNFMLPTASSLSKMVPQSPSPRKPVHQQQVWLPPSPSPSKLSIGKFVSHSALRSPQSSSKRLPAMSRLPQPIRTPQRQVLGEVTSNSALKTPSGNNVMRTPSSVNKKSATSLKAAYAAVASPVATFVKNNPAPHLVQ